MKKLLILLSFSLAIHLGACTSYGLLVMTAEEQVENVGMQQLLEEEISKKSEFIRSSFALQNPFKSDLFAFHCNENFGGFSSYELRIHVPPPNFFPVLS